MKKLICLLLLLPQLALLSAQDRKYRTGIDFLTSNFNSGKYGAIYDRFSDKSKESIPAEMITVAFDTLFRQNGKIKQAQFLEMIGESLSGYHSRPYAHYKVRFQQDSLSFYFAMDSVGKFSDMYMVPYKELRPAVNGLASDASLLAQDGYSYIRNLPDQTQFAVAVIDRGQTSFYGLVRQNDTIKSIENSGAGFEIGSLTKLFTATALADLVEEKKLKLESNINSYYDFPFYGNAKITFEALANHTSGLPNLPEDFYGMASYDDPYKSYGEKQLLAYLKSKLNLQSPSGQKYSYSNFGFGLLGYSLALSQKTSFAKLLQDLIFMPYGMTNTFSTVADAKRKAGYTLIKGLDENGEEVSHWNFDALMGAGSVVSTSADFAKFLLAQFNGGNKAMVLTRKPTFRVDDKIHVGLAWNIFKTNYWKELYWQNGGTGGFFSSVLVDLSSKKAVLVLSNVSPNNLDHQDVENLCFSLMQKLREKY